ncbi:PCC domain-containing protein [Planosporangium sp. 12N6]|uniref:PCC domain-containing protein n=1 Tax=Planosporangium spinosum TaxID=3402278 RepID=UPI003CF75CE3
MFVVSVGKGEEVLETIARHVQERGVRAAAITLIGAVQGCCVSVMPKGDPLDDILTEHDQPFELTGTGEVTDGKVHVHAVLGGEGVTVAGHLHWAKVQDWFVRAYVTPVA